MTTDALQQKLDALLRRKADLEAKLGVSKATEKASSRHSDQKFRVSSERAVQARNKKSEKAMLQVVEQMIRRTRSQLAQQKPN